MFVKLLTLLLLVALSEGYTFKGVFESDFNASFSCPRGQMSPIFQNLSFVYDRPSDALTVGITCKRNNYTRSCACINLLLGDPNGFGLGSTASDQPPLYVIGESALGIFALFEVEAFTLRAQWDLNVTFGPKVLSAFVNYNANSSFVFTLRNFSSLPYGLSSPLQAFSLPFLVYATNCLDGLATSIWPLPIGVPFYNATNFTSFLDPLKPPPMTTAPVRWTVWLFNYVHVWLNASCVLAPLPLRDPHNCSVTYPRQTCYGCRDYAEWSTGACYSPCVDWPDQSDVAAGLPAIGEPSDAPTTLAPTAAPTTAPNTAQACMGYLNAAIRFDLALVSELAAGYRIASLTGVGDLNDDFVEEIAVGVPEANGGIGAVLVFFFDSDNSFLRSFTLHPPTLEEYGYDGTTKYAAFGKTLTTVLTSTGLMRLVASVVLNDNYTAIYMMEVNNRGLVGYTFMPLTPLFEFEAPSQFTVLNFIATIEVSYAAIYAGPNGSTYPVVGYYFVTDSGSLIGARALNLPSFDALVAEYVDVPTGYATAAPEAKPAYFAALDQTACGVNTTGQTFRINSMLTKNLDSSASISLICVVNNVTTFSGPNCGTRRWSLEWMLFVVWPNTRNYQIYTREDIPLAPGRSRRDFVESCFCASITEIHSKTFPGNFSVTISSLLEETIYVVNMRLYPSTASSSIDSSSKFTLNEVERPSVSTVLSNPFFGVSTYGHVPGNGTRFSFAQAPHYPVYVSSGSALWGINLNDTFEPVPANESIQNITSRAPVAPSGSVAPSKAANETNTSTVVFSLTQVAESSAMSCLYCTVERPISVPSGPGLVSRSVYVPDTTAWLNTSYGQTLARYGKDNNTRVCFPSVVLTGLGSVSANMMLFVLSINETDSNQVERFSIDFTTIEFVQIIDEARNRTVYSVDIPVPSPPVPSPPPTDVTDNATTTPTAEMPPAPPRKNITIIFEFMSVYTPPGSDNGFNASNIDYSIPFYMESYSVKVNYTIMNWPFAGPQNKLNVWMKYKLSGSLLATLRNDTYYAGKVTLESLYVYNAVFKLMVPQYFVLNDIAQVSKSLFSFRTNEYTSMLSYTFPYGSSIKYSQSLSLSLGNFTDIQSTLHQDQDEAWIIAISVTFGVLAILFVFLSIGAIIVITRQIDYQSKIEMREENWKQVERSSVDLASISVQPASPNPSNFEVT